MRDNVVAVFIVNGLAVVAFILLLKYTSSYLPDSGFIGTVKGVINSI